MLLASAVHDRVNNFSLLNRDIQLGVIAESLESFREFCMSYIKGLTIFFLIRYRGWTTDIELTSFPILNRCTQRIVRTEI